MPGCSVAWPSVRLLSLLLCFLAFNCTAEIQCARLRGASVGLRKGAEFASTQYSSAAKSLELRRLRGGCEDAEDGVEEEAEQEGDDDEEDGPMNINKAIKEVLFYARIHFGLARGLKEVIQSLERGEAQLVILAEDCDEEKYVAVLEGLCTQKGVYLLKVPERDQLGAWAGQAKLNDQGDPGKTCGASSVAVKDFGEQSEGLAFLLEHIKSQQADDDGEGDDEGENMDGADDDGGENEEEEDDE